MFFMKNYAVYCRLHRTAFEFSLNGSLILFISGYSTRYFNSHLCSKSNLMWIFGYTTISLKYFATLSNRQFVEKYELQVYQGVNSFEIHGLHARYFDG